MANCELVAFRLKADFPMRIRKGRRAAVGLDVQAFEEGLSNLLRSKGELALNVIGAAMDSAGNKMLNVLIIPRSESASSARSIALEFQSQAKNPNSLLRAAPSMLMEGHCHCSLAPDDLVVYLPQ